RTDRHQRQCDQHDHSRDSADSHSSHDAPPVPILPRPANTLYFATRFAIVLPPAQERTNMKIAVMPGDGVGKEVIAEGLKVLKVAARKFGFNYETTNYPFSGEYYLQTKLTF